MDVYLKCENFQRAGAFKFRGAYNAISQLTSDQREAGVITHSNGNHAQGVTLAAKLLGVRAIVVMPENAPPIKRAATEGYGAEIVPCQAIEGEAVTDSLLAAHGYTLIHPYDNDQIPETIANGLSPLHIGKRNLTIFRSYVADNSTVSEEAIIRTFGFIWDRLKIIAEPSSAVALAPLLDEPYQGQYRGSESSSAAATLT